MQDTQEAGYKIMNLVNLYMYLWHYMNYTMSLCDKDVIGEYNVVINSSNKFHKIFKNFYLTALMYHT